MQPPRPRPPAPGPGQRVSLALPGPGVEGNTAPASTGCRLPDTGSGLRPRREAACSLPSPRGVQGSRELDSSGLGPRRPGFPAGSARPALFPASGGQTLSSQKEMIFQCLLDSSTQKSHKQFEPTTSQSNSNRPPCLLFPGLRFGTGQQNQIPMHTKAAAAH